MVRVSARRAIGIALTAIGLILLSMSVPMLMVDPNFTAYSYQGGNPQVDQQLNLMIGGIMILPFGLIFLLKGRTI